MGIRSIMVAMLGIAVAGGSAYMARDYIQTSTATASTEKQPALVSVVVAARDIQFGQQIEPDMLTTIGWPRAALPPGAVTDMAAMLPASDQPPRRAKRAMAQGELLLSSKVSDFGEKVTIVQSLGPNARAMAINVDAATAVGGFVTPGDRVDVLLTQGGNANLRTVTILQNIRVIGVDQNSNENKDQPEIARTVTVEVTPAQGQTLALAQRAGTLSLSLRSLDEPVDKPLDSIRLSDVLREKSPEPKAEVRKSTIIVRRGSEVQTVTLNN